MKDWVSFLERELEDVGIVGACATPAGDEVLAGVPLSDEIVILTEDALEEMITVAKSDTDAQAVLEEWGVSDKVDDWHV